MDIMKVGLPTAHQLVAVNEGYTWECLTEVRTLRADLLWKACLCLQQHQSWLGCTNGTVQLERLLRGILPTSVGHLRWARAQRDVVAAASPLRHPALGVMQEGGWGLHNVQRDAEWKLKGIVNGMDYSEWSPQADASLKVGGVWCTACDLPHTSACAQGVLAGLCMCMCMDSALGIQVLPAASLAKAGGRGGARTPLCVPNPQHPARVTSRVCLAQSQAWMAKEPAEMCGVVLSSNG